VGARSYGAPRYGRGWRFALFDEAGVMVYRSGEVYQSAEAAEAAGVHMVGDGETVMAVRNIPELGGYRHGTR
jgi:hypothetical protein